MPFAATWTDLEMIILREINQTEKDKHHMMSLNLWTLKHNTNELIYQTETGSQRTDLRFS